MLAHTNDHLSEINLQHDTSESFLSRCLAQDAVHLSKSLAKWLYLWSMSHTSCSSGCRSWQIQSTRCGLMVARKAMRQASAIMCTKDIQSPPQALQESTRRCMTTLPSTWTRSMSQLNSSSIHSHRPDSQPIPMMRSGGSTSRIPAGQSKPPLSLAVKLLTWSEEGPAYGSFWSVLHTALELSAVSKKYRTEMLTSECHDICRRWNVASLVSACQ